MVGISQESQSAIAAASTACTTKWQADLKKLFEQAKERFPDVVWELLTDDMTIPEEVWGHKAIIYARAPPSFQARYFNFRPAPIPSPHPYSASPVPTLSLPAHSSLSLTLNGELPSPPRSVSPYATPRGSSPAPTTGSVGVLRLPTAISPALFTNELEYLYTGRGIGAAFEFLFDASDQRSEGDSEEHRVDKLRKDLVYMWRSRLYSDMRINLTGIFSPDGEPTTAVFSSHRFILASRSSYFRNALSPSSGFAPPSAPGSIVTVNLPSPPFTPASIHFTLGFMYTGTLYFSHRSFDLATAFHIVRSAIYLSLDDLYHEIEARIVEDMMHGLFHAFLTFDDYEKVTGGRWGVGGCKCKTCIRRTPRVLEFAMAEDVKNQILERGARRALVGMFGEGWVTPEFAGLPERVRGSALKGVQTRSTPSNIFPLLFAAQAALKKLEASVAEDWIDSVRELVVQARKKIDDVMCSRCEMAFEQEEWLSMLERDGAKFGDSERIGWTMDSFHRGLSDANAGRAYQTLVSSVLIRPHPTTGSTLLSSISSVRTQVEKGRTDLVRWLRKRWMGVRLQAGFNDLEGWALKEISDELEVPVDDLLAPDDPKGPATRSGLHSAHSTMRDTETADSVSIASLRASIRNKNLEKVNAGPVKDSSSSIKSSLRSSVASSVAPRAGPSRLAPSTTTPRSKPVSTASGPGVIAATRSPVAPSFTSRSTTSRKSISPSQKSVVENRAKSPETVNRPKSIAPSVHSVRSTTSTLRNASLQVPSEKSAANNRPVSTASTRSTATTSFRTAPSSQAGSTTRTRSLSGASTASHISAHEDLLIPSTPEKGRPRRISTASVSSTTSSVSPTAIKPSVKKSPKVPEARLGSVTPVGRRTPSNASLRSTSTAATDKRKVSPKIKPLDNPTEAPLPPLPVTIIAATPTTLSAPPTPSVPSVPSAIESPASDNDRSNSETAPELPEKPKSRPTSSTKATDTATLRPSTANGLRRQRSNDTITKSSGTASTARLSTATPTPKSQKGVIRGITLNVGIPCMITSKRSRFKAFARYIGEVEGERGPWVGVEVPVGEAWGPDKLEGRDWNDGSHCGVRYFEIGGGMLAEEDERAARRRRLNSGTDGSVATLKKREADSLLSSEQDRAKRLRSMSPAASDVSMGETRGLFIRPQQILLVLDAQERN